MNQQDRSHGETRTKQSEKKRERKKEIKRSVKRKKVNRIKLYCCQADS